MVILLKDILNGYSDSSGDNEFLIERVNIMSKNPDNAR